MQPTIPNLNAPDEQSDLVNVHVLANYEATVGLTIIDVKVKNNKILAILDTGSAISLINKKLVPETATILQPKKYNILVANGSALHATGTCEILVKIGSARYPIEFQIVDDLPYEMIIGNDFLNGKVKIDLIKGITKFKVTRDRFSSPRSKSKRPYSLVTVPLHIFKQPVATCAIKLDEDVTIPANHQITIPVPCPAAEVDFIGSTRLFEPKTHKGKVFSARSVMSIDTTLSVNLINLSDKSVKLYKGSTLGELQPLEDTIESRFADLHFETFTERSDFEKKVNLDSNNLSAEDKQRVLDMLWKNKEAFAFNPKKPPTTTATQHTINVENAKPINVPPHRQPPRVDKIVSEHITEMLDNNLIYGSHSPWASPVVLAKKKDGTWRFCVDYRRLNAVTKREAYPIPRIDDTLHSLSGNIFFSALDCASGYWQIEINKKDREKTAFITKHGLFEFRVMPFGLTNAPATWQRTMDLVLAGLKWQICLVYLDDIIVFSKTVDEHMTNLQLVFDALMKHNISLRLDKCHFFQSKVKYLGYNVSKEGIAIDVDKIKSILDYKPPHDLHSVRRFLGLCNVYRKFIPQYAMLTAPITLLTRKNTKFIWSDTCQQVFETMKEKLTTAPILAFPDFNQQFILTTDASDIGISAILSQGPEGMERVIEYASRPFTSAESNYFTTERECLALIWGIHHYRPYLLQSKFLANTDHRALAFANTFKDLNQRVGRWYMTLQDYQYEIKHKPGTEIPHADALSRSVLSIGTEIPIDISKLDLARFRSEQQSDKSLDFFRVLAQTGDKDKRERFFFENDLLYREWIPNLKHQTEVVKQLVVPRNLREIILKQFHEDIFGGHYGIVKTLPMIRARFFWPGLKGDLEYWIKTCQDCESRKTPKFVRNAGMLQSLPIPSRPFEVIGMDFMGPLIETTLGNKHILVIVDYLTKVGKAFATGSQQAGTVAKEFIEKIVCQFGTPKKVITDRAKDFIGEVMSSVYKLLNIEGAPATADHQQTDGQAENVNKTFIDQLSHHVNATQKDWDTFLPYVEMSYNSKVHISTKFSPFQLLYGHEMHLPIDVPLDLMKSEPAANLDEYSKQLVSRMINAREQAKGNVSKAHEAQARNYNKRHKPIEYEVGDIVRMFKPRKEKKGKDDKKVNRKFDHLWRGPYKIVEKPTPLLYQLMDPATGLYLDGLTNVQSLKPAEYYDELPSVVATRMAIPSTAPAQHKASTESALQSGPMNTSVDSSHSAPEPSVHEIENDTNQLVPSDPIPNIPTDVLPESSPLKDNIASEPTPTKTTETTNSPQLSDVIAAFKKRKRKPKNGKSTLQYFVRFKPELNKPDAWINHNFVPFKLRKQVNIIFSSRSVKSTGVAVNMLREISNKGRKVWVRRESPPCVNESAVSLSRVAGVIGDSGGKTNQCTFYSS